MEVSRLKKEQISTAVCSISYNKDSSLLTQLRFTHTGKSVLLHNLWQIDLHRLQLIVSSVTLSCEASVRPNRLRSAPWGWCSKPLNHDRHSLGGFSSDTRIVCSISSSWASNASSASDDGMTVKNLKSYKKMCTVRMEIFTLKIKLVHLFSDIMLGNKCLNYPSKHFILFWKFDIKTAFHCYLWSELIHSRSYSSSVMLSFCPTVT